MKHTPIVSSPKCLWVLGQKVGFEPFFLNVSIDTDEPDAQRRSVSERIIRRVLSQANR